MNISTITWQAMQNAQLLSKNILIILLMTFFGTLSKSYGGVDYPQFIKESLEKNGVKFVELEGLGFGIENEGNHQLNKIAKSVYEKMSIFIVLDTRNTKELGKYIPDANAIFVRVDETNIKDLATWRPSDVRSILLHELRHVFLAKQFDEKNIITSLSATLIGKKPDVITSLTNPYYEYLNFQEFSTFTLQLKHLHQGLLSTQNQIQFSQLFKVVTTLLNFSDASLVALRYFAKNLENPEVDFTEKVIERPNYKIRYLELNSPDWNLNFLVDLNIDGNKTRASIDSTHKRIAQTLDIIERINKKARELREILLTENKDILVVIKKPIDELNKLARSSYEISSSRCEKLFSF